MKTKASITDSIRHDRILAPPAATDRVFAGMTSTDRAPHEEILHRAYAIWEREGHPDGRQLENWLEAEGEVLHQV